MTKEIKVTPKYEQLADEIRKMIESGAYAPGSKVPSERDLAKKYSVNLTTVNKALSTLQAEGLLYREHGRGTFVKEKAKSKICAFVCYYLNHNSGEIVDGIEEVFSRSGYRLNVQCSNGSLSKEKAIIEELSNEVDGLIVCPMLEDGQGNSNVYRELQSKHFPFVLVDRYFEDLESDYSVADNYSGSFEITKSLISKGHKRIAHLMSPSRSTTVLERLRGYRDALKDCGIPIEESLIRSISFRQNLNYDYFKEVDSIIESWLSVEEPPSAITATADELAILAMKVLLARGVDIPSEMALAGFDNSNLGALAEVPLTSVEVDFRRMGFDAAETLLHRMSSGEFKPFRQTVLPVKLIERSSSVPGSSKGWGWGKALNCAIAR